MSIKLNKNPQERLAINYGPASRASPRLRWAFLVLLLSLPFLFFLFKLTQEYIIIKFPGQVVYDVLMIRSPDAGYIKKIVVQPGQQVKAHSLLIEFSSPELEAKLKYLNAERLRTLTLVNSLQTTTQNLLSPFIDVAKKEISDSAIVYDRFKKYQNNGNLVELQVDEARRNYVSAKESYINLLQQINTLKLNNESLFEVNFVRKLHEIDSEIQQINIRLNSYLLYTPQNATVMNILTHQDEYLAAGQNLMTLVTKQHLRVVAFIDPKYLNEIHINQKVSIQFPNNQKTNGHIINTPSYAEKMPLSEINPLATRQNKLIAIIELDEDIPTQYKVFGIPVRVKLK